MLNVDCGNPALAFNFSLEAECHFVLQMIGANASATLFNLLLHYCRHLEMNSCGFNKERSYFFHSRVNPIIHCFFFGIDKFIDF